MTIQHEVATRWSYIYKYRYKPETHKQHAVPPHHRTFARIPAAEIFTSRHAPSCYVTIAGFTTARNDTSVKHVERPSPTPVTSIDISNLSISVADGTSAKCATPHSFRLHISVATLLKSILEDLKYDSSFLYIGFYIPHLTF